MVPGRSEISGNEMPPASCQVHAESSAVNDHRRACGMTIPAQADGIRPRSGPCRPTGCRRVRFGDEGRGVDRQAPRGSRTVNNLQARKPPATKLSGSARYRTADGDEDRNDDDPNTASLNSVLGRSPVRFWTSARISISVAMQLAITRHDEDQNMVQLTGRDRAPQRVDQQRHRRRRR